MDYSFAIALLKLAYISRSYLIIQKRQQDEVRVKRILHTVDWDTARLGLHRMEQRRIAKANTQLVSDRLAITTEERKRTTKMDWTARVRKTWKALA